MLIYCALFIWGGSPTAEAMDFDVFYHESDTTEKQRVPQEKSWKQKMAKTAKANTERRAKFLWADLFKWNTLFFIYNERW